MLDLEQIEMGTVASLNWQDCDLALVIQESQEEMTLAAEAKKVAIAVDGPRSLRVRVDEDRIRQVLTNLLANAVKFAPPDTVVTLSFRREAGWVVVEVRDRGPGVAPAEADKIFEKFYKLGDKEGSGLGLAICRSIIEAHGGHIGIRQNAKTTGGCFFFQLPGN
jgi:signal transduction histidine kinase